MAPTQAEIVIARKQLRLAPSESDDKIPRAYVLELKKLLKIFPNDTKFRVIPDPTKSYGKIFCEEDDCQTYIPMERNVMAPHGGKTDGIGGLTCYMKHIQQHSSHSKSRNERLSLSQSSSGAIPVTQRSISGAKKPLAMARRRASMGTSLIKSEPDEVTIPKKRHSDVASSSPLKRLKREDTITIPLTDTNTHRVATLDPIDVAQTRELMADLQAQLGKNYAYRDRIDQKKKKTKSDETRRVRFTVNINSLENQIASLRTSLPQASPVKRSTSSRSLLQIKGEPSLPMIPKTESQLPAFHNPSFAAPGLFAGASAIALGSGRLPGFSGLSGLPKREEDDSDDDTNIDVDARQSAILNRVTGEYIPFLAPAANADSYDDNGDFHGRGRDTFQGPVARADDIDMFLKSAGNAEAFDQNVDVNKCLQKLGLPDIIALLPGMEVPLMPHQVIGVSWMLEKEADKIASGGILGDDMGLGKTVQMIALMLKNRSRDKTCKTNLIITPKALLSQWKLEVELKTNNGLTCLIYHGSSKVRRKADLLKYDVVLTTFQTMASEWPDFEANQKKRDKARRKSTNSSDRFVVSDSDDDIKPKTKQQRGLLFQVDFYRIILDEGHNIRNRRNRMSRAVTELNAKYRWVLTGTPIINSLCDIYGYFRFLKLRPWYDWQEFNGHIGLLEKKNPSLAMTRLQAIFKACLMRRMKNTMLDGKRLIELPEKTIVLTRLEFIKEERDIYTMVESRSQAAFNRFLRAGTVLKNYSQVLVLLLRLRQICSHPALVQENGMSFISSEEDEDNWNPHVRDELIRARDEVSPEFVNKMKKQLKEAALERIKAEKESADAVVDEECPVCFDALTSARVTPCCHVFCRECLDNMFDAPLPTVDGDPAKYRENERPCPKCRSPVNKNTLFDRSIFEPTNAELFPKETTVVFKNKQTAAKGKGKAKAPATFRGAAPDVIDLEAMDIDEDEEQEDEDEDMDDFIVDDDDDEYRPSRGSSSKQSSTKPKSTCVGTRRKPFVVLDSDEEADDEPTAKEVVFGQKKEELPPDALQFKFLASSKMKYMMTQIMTLFKEKPDEKIIIISQWTSCLDLVSKYLEEKGVTHVKYQGDMSTSHRDMSVRLFMSRDKERVMLLSLKCGGVGLNLTRANNVISLDLGWSQAVENQAYDRTHRLGQTRSVKVERLVIQNTVEDRILALQERKQTLAEGSLGEGKGKKIGKLSVKELASLFGLDARGRVLDP